MRREYEMTNEQLATLLDAGKAVPYLVVGGYEPPSPQENANKAWQRLADELGFVWDSVQPSSKGDRVFTAEPREQKP